MSRRAVILAGGLVVLVYLVLVLATDEVGLARRAGGGWTLAGAEAVAADPDLADAYPMLLEDWYDRLAYQQRGRWLASGGRPYLDEFAEYPQLSVMVMALPYLWFDHGVVRGEPFGSEARLDALLAGRGVGPEDRRAIRDALRASGRSETDAAPRLGDAQRLWPEADGAAGAELLAAARDVWSANRVRHEELVGNRTAYGDRHHVHMALLFVALLATVTASLRALGASPAWALMLCLPGTLYFGFNRLDLVVTNLVALALHFQLRARARTAAAFLGLAIMAKWYPLVLVPAFLAQSARRAAPGRRVAAVAAPAAVLGAVVAAFLALTFAWGGGGLDAVLALPRWYANERQPNHASLLAVLTHPDRWALVPLSARPTLELAFKALQLLPGLLVALVPGRSNRHLLGAALVATLCMIVFSEFFSPQWVIWVTLLGAHLAPARRRYLLLCAALEVVMYVQLPLMHFSSQATGEFDAFWRWTAVRHAATLAFLAVAVATFLLDARRERGQSNAGSPASAPAST